MTVARFVFVTLMSIAFPVTGSPQSTTPAAPPDPERGIATSMFGTFIKKGELIVYPFFEAYVDDNFEYKPDEFGASGDQDYRGRYRAREGLLLLSYGLSDRVSVEIEIAGISASLEKAQADRSMLPARIEESGLGDVEGQVRWRWNRETSSRPEIFSYAEVVVPHHKEKVLIGTSGAEIKFGTGVVRGLSWGTIIARAAVEYATGSTSQFDASEYAIELIKPLGRHMRLYAGIEGTQDELSAIAELQWRVSNRVTLKFNNGFGLTSKATDFAPEVGILFSLPIR